MPRIAQRVAAFGTTIFTEMNELATAHNALNLGQGKPDFDGSPALIEAYIEALRSGKHNQYAPGRGIAPLRQGIAEHAGKFYGLEVDPNEGVIVTPGATEALFAAIMGLIDPGDEAIVIEPFFDSYVPGIQMAGGIPVYVPLHAPDWTFDEAELRAAFTEKTRVILLNTPHNPTGRVFTLEELQLIADLCIEHDVTVISDEVYEHLTFGDARHIPIATLPGMWERTLTIGSAGKTFGMTGWKVGWAYGAPEIVRGMHGAHQYIAFALNHPAQVAVAEGFKMGDDYFRDYRALYEGKRHLMMQALDAGGFRYVAPQGTYFVMGGFEDLFDGDSDAFAHYLIREIGVAVIPPRTFYSPAHEALGRHTVRFSFAKEDAALHEAAERLHKLHPIRRQIRNQKFT